MFLLNQVAEYSTSMLNQEHGIPELQPQKAKKKLIYICQPAISNP